MRPLTSSPEPLVGIDRGGATWLPSSASAASVRSYRRRSDAVQGAQAVAPAPRQAASGPISASEELPRLRLVGDAQKPSRTSYA